MSGEFGDEFRGAQVGFPALPDDARQPNGRPPHGLSGDSVLAIFVALIGIASVVFQLDWIVRSALVVCAIGLTIFGAGRHSAHPAIRAIVGILVIAIFIVFSWRPIWDDFRQKHPTVTLAWAEDWIKEKWYGPSPPPPPYVTTDEIEAAQKHGRILLNYSPVEMIGLWERGQDIGLYLNKWIKIELRFAVPTSQTVNKKKYLVIDGQLPSYAFMQAFLSAYFDQEKWEAKLTSLRPEDTVRAVCQLNRIERKEDKRQVMGQIITYYVDRIFAYSCDPL
jgi:hypothetical protein